MHVLELQYMHVLELQYMHVLEVQYMHVLELHVSCPIRLMVHRVEYGGSGGRSPPECRGVWGAAGPPTFETNLFLDHFFFDMVFLRGVRGVV